MRGSFLKGEKMDFKERVDRIKNPLSKEELETRLFEKGEKLPQWQLKLLEKLDALKYLTSLRDQLISPEQNSVIKKVLKYETIEPMSLVKKILKPDLIKGDADYETRWHLTDFTPEIEIELTARLLQKLGLDALIERLREKHYDNRYNNCYYDKLNVSFDLCWEENNLEHRVSIMATGEPWRSNGQDVYAYIKTQSFRHIIYPSVTVKDERSYYKGKTNQSEFEEFLAHAFVLSKFDPEKEKEELEKTKKEMERSGVLVVPVPIGPSLDMQLILQQMAAGQITAKLGEIETLLRGRL